MATPGSAADAPPAGQQKVVDLINVIMPALVVLPSEPPTLTVFALAAIAIVLVHLYRRRRPSQRKIRASTSER